VAEEENAERRIPITLTIAGSDSSGGAGVQADLKTFSALGVYGLSAVTCVVAEIPGKVSRIEPLSPALVREQIEVLAKSFPIAAIKTGLLCSAKIITTVVQAIARRAVAERRRVDLGPKIPLVVDPVFVATTGDVLLPDEAIEVCEKELFPRATLITPNLDEAARLLRAEIPDDQSMAEAAEKLAHKYGASVLLKGGHLAGEHAVDVLFAGGQLTKFTAPFIRRVATHGTGCTYSAAITAGLASGLSLLDAIGRAKKFVTAAIKQRFRWQSLSGEQLDALNHRPNERVD
jgi:hydroxymethylpyrimidine/phosphomethylpyrimidine kinase